jgi:hypothetical protein
MASVNEHHGQDNEHLPDPGSEKVIMNISHQCPAYGGGLVPWGHWLRHRAGQSRRLPVRCLLHQLVARRQECTRQKISDTEQVISTEVAAYLGRVGSTG